jgi:hypothetical protein
MAYIKRNHAGNIIALAETPFENSDEQLPIDSPELIQYLIDSSSSDEAKTALSGSDYTLIRVIEDIVNTLVERNIILFTDLPQAAQEKLSSRQKVRGHLNNLNNLISDDEGMF